eukprot:SAG22_NODE_4071_length_1397_cov_1.671032_2_plen_84_part_00
MFMARAFRVMSAVRRRSEPSSPPANSSIFLPFSQNWKVGMLRICWPTLADCTFTFTKTARPAYSFAMFLKIGAIIRHGPQESE